LHILPLLVLTFYVALALPESPFLLMGTLGFCSAYRTLFLLNIILSGADLKELPNLPEESSTASDAFDSAPPKFEGQEATTKRAFLGKIYNWSTWKKLSDSNIDPYSSLIYIPLENYFFIAQLYKGIHMLITAPLVVADFLALSAQNAGKVQSTFTGAIKRTGHTAFDFAKRADNTFMPSRYSFFGKQEISQRPQRAYQLSSAYYTDSAQKLPTHSMSPAL
jgi:hypothetical protein